MNWSYDNLTDDTLCRENSINPIINPLYVLPIYNHKRYALENNRLFDPGFIIEPINI